MKSFDVPSREQAKPESQLLFDTLQKRLGKVPNLYAAMSYSAHALKGFMDFEDEINHGVFTAKEREAVALVVSQVNNCEYCLAGHTAAALKRGFTKDEIIAIRKGEVPDRRLNAIIKLAKSMAENEGRAEESMLIRFYMAGFLEAGVIELIGLVTIRIFTNYVFALTQVPIDFPEVEPLS